MLKDRQLVLTWDRSRDPSWLRSREWLVTNGLGGYASGTLAGSPARKYHGLFVPNLSAPQGRHILISRCDELVPWDGGLLNLGGAEFENGVFSGDAHRCLREFRLDYMMPTWVFEIGDAVFEKSIVMPNGHNTVCVQYRLLSGPALELRIRPYVSFRRHDESPAETPGDQFLLEVQRGRHEIRHRDSQLVLRLSVRPGYAPFVTDERDEHQFMYHIDRDRGDQAYESAFSPGYFITRIEAGRPSLFMASTHAWDRIEFDPATLFDAERRRIRTLLSLAPQMEGDAFAEQLAMAADQFIVLPGSRTEESVMARAEGTELRSVYAGYHWFGDWGRDTMISLEGLTVCTGRYREAGAILRTFSNYVKDGLLPNLFPEGERQALYHTVDATLWYFHAISRYIEASGDRTLMPQLLPVLQSIIEHHLHGTHFNIHVDPADGLIAASADGLQLTWMDAKVDGWVVTPRRGKPVEIQALWYNALQLMARWCAEQQPLADSYRLHAQQARESFNRRFWNEAHGCLYDVVDGPGEDDASIRPNQIFALSLSHPILDESRWRSVVDVVRERLVTPVGLRTLSADHPDYKRHYRGDLRSRDAAYHQGTVWPWLIGHFVDASLKVDAEPLAARRMVEAFIDHLGDGGIGSISEIFDAEAPHAPGGCIAQAWSVAEVLRAWLKTRTR